MLFPNGASQSVHFRILPKKREWCKARQTPNLSVIPFGYFVLRFGRRTVLLWSSLMAMIAGACAAFVPTFAGYVLFRFLTGAGLIGIILTRNCLSKCHADSHILLILLWGRTQKDRDVPSLATREQASSGKSIINVIEVSQV